MDLCQQQGIKGAKMCSDTEISKGLLTDLKMGRRSGVSAATAQKIASYFGVSVGYLLGEEDTKKSPGKMEELTEGEKIWLKLYNELSAETKEVLVEVANKFERLPAETQEFLLGAVRVALNNQK